MMWQARSAVQKPQIFAGFEYWPGRPSLPSSPCLSDLCCYQYLAGKASPKGNTFAPIVFIKRLFWSEKMFQFVCMTTLYVILWHHIIVIQCHTYFTYTMYQNIVGIQIPTIQQVKYIQYCRCLQTYNIVVNGDILCFLQHSIDYIRHCVPYGQHTIYYIVCI